MPKRIHASLVHLCVSVFLVSSVLLFVVLLWYPGIYFQAMGVSKMLLILASVDVTIGPLITLIIFVPGKKGLKFDLIVIAILQLMALSYGAYMVFAGRPVYSVYNVGMFTLVSATEIHPAALKNAQIHRLPISGPKIVGARMPANSKERQGILFSALDGGADLPQLPQYYLPYQELADEVKTRLWSLDVLIQRQPKAKANQVRALINDAVRENGLQIADVGFIPMRAKVHDLTVMVRRSDASIVAILPLDPWGAS